MTEMIAHTTTQQLPVHVFHNGILVDTPPSFDDWSAIEEDMARITWEALLLFNPNEAVSLADAFTQW